MGAYLLPWLDYTFISHKVLETQTAHRTGQTCQLCLCDILPVAAGLMGIDARRPKHCQSYVYILRTLTYA